MVVALSFTGLSENGINEAFYFKTNPALMNLNTKYLRRDRLCIYIQTAIPIDEMFSYHFDKYKKPVYYRPKSRGVCHHS